MEVQSEPRQVPRYRFGSIEVDPAAGEIYKSGIKVRVPKKPFQILMALLERPGEVVTRETLRGELWSRDTFVEFEHALNAAINRLRLALGDDAANPRFIETIPGRGYRLIAPVEIPSRPIVVEIPAATRKPLPSRWIVVSAAAVLLALLTGIWIGRQGTQAPVPSPVASMVRFTIPPPPGSVFEPVTARQSFQVSPDGRYLAFMARNQRSQLSIWIRDFAQPESREVPDTKGCYSLFWSPDSKYLYYTVYVGGELRRISMTGGPQDVLAHAPPRFFGAWFHQGEMRSADRENGWAVPTAGGATRSLPLAQTWAQSLPNEDRVIYAAWDEAKNVNQVRLARPDQPGTVLFESDSRVLLTPSSRNPDRTWLLYMRGSNLVARGFDSRSGRLTSDGPYPIAAHVPYFRSTGAVEASVGGGSLVWMDHPDRAQLVWVDRQGNELATVGDPLSTFNHVRLSADGRWALMPVMDRTRGAPDLWTVEIATGSARRVSILPAAHDSPVFSPDARRIVYGKAYGHSPVLAMLPLEQSIAVQPLPEGVPQGNFQQPSDWSPDGRFIAETSTPITHPGSQQNADIYLVDLTRNTELVPLLVGPRQEFGAVFSPDGRSIAFIADDSGRMEAYVQSFDAEKRQLTGIRRQISHGGARLLRWPKPGTEIFYLGADSWIYSTDLSGQAKRLFAVPQQANYMMHPPFSFDVAPGGERILLPAYRGDRPLSLSVVLNWENLIGGASVTTASMQ